jgi:hypothetical protein
MNGERRTDVKFDRRKDMNKKLEQEIKDYIHLAVQSGKAENSGLVSEILRQMDRHIEVSVKKHINGTITSIQTQLEDYIESDNNWKKQYEPYIEGLANVSSGGKIIVAICLGISAITGTLIAIKAFFK